MDRSGSSFLSSTAPKKRVKKRRLKRKPQQPSQNQSTYQLYTNNLFNSLFNGEKFSGGYGYASQYYDFVDYWELRAKSVELFTKNLYAAGLINRLVTNIINTGLSLEATPVSDILPIDDDQANDWSETVENLWRIWGNQKDLVDWKKLNTEGELQAQAKRTAYLSGDVLIILRQSPVTGLPITELVDGRHIQNPTDKNFAEQAEKRGNKIVHGVEIDNNGRHIAFYRNIIKNKKPTSQRIPAQGPKSGRKIAWLLYGSKRLLDDIRGIPLLGMVAQSLNEIDKYRDSEQRAAVVNSMLAMFVKKGTDKPGTRPLTGGAKRRDKAEVTQGDGSTKEYSIDKWLPGMAIDELQVGEEPVSFDTKRPNSGFNVFEQAIISAVAWTNEIPPEVLKLEFQSNFSSSRQANSEFKMFLDKERFLFSSSFCKPRFENWLISMTLTGRVKAPGLLEAWRDPAKFDIYGAWTDSDWNGAIKPHVDPLKETNAYIAKVKAGFITNARAARELTGMKFSTNMKTLKKENEQKVKANQPLADATSESTSDQQVENQAEQLINALSDRFELMIEEKLEQFQMVS